MTEPPPKFRFAAVLWSLLIAGGAIFLAGSILLPSTKRASFDFQRQEQAGSGDPDASPGVPTTVPTSGATAAPSALATDASADAPTTGPAQP